MAKIIVGVDESDRGTDAIALASQLARGSDAEAVLVNAYADDDTRGRGANTAHRTEMRDEAQRALQRACEEFPDLGEMERRTIADISPAKALQEMAVREDAPGRSWRDPAPRAARLAAPGSATEGEP